MKILHDDILQKELTENGYTIFRELDVQIVEDLLDFYASLQSPFEKGFHPSLMWNETEIKKNISNKITSLLEDWINQHFTHHKILYGNFMVKEPGEESKMKLHQDWSYVDENKYSSFAIWFPLQDLNEKNGTLSMIPKSHLFQNHERGPGVHCPFASNETHLIEKYGQPLYLKAGQPVVWEHHLLHYSPPNFSNQSRIAVTAIIVPKDASIYHYYKIDDQTEIEQYEVEPDFYFHYNIIEPPQKFARKIYSFSTKTINFTPEQLDAKLAKHPSTDWWIKIKKIFT